MLAASRRATPWNRPGKAPLKSLMRNDYFRQSRRAAAGPLAERGLGGDSGLGLLGGGQVPVEDLGSVPVQHAFEASDMVVDRFEILDTVRLAADVGMDRKRHDLGAAL